MTDPVHGSRASTSRWSRIVFKVGSILALTVVARACGEPLPAPEAGLTVVRDTVGDTIVVRNVSGRSWPPGVRLEEDLVIGTLGGPAETTFGDITHLADDGRGGVYVFDRQVPVLRHFDGAGAYLGDVGREGQGPGEYDWTILGLGVDAGDTLWLADWSNRRLTRFAPDGSLVDVIPARTRYFTTVPNAPGFHVTPDGTGILAERLDSTEGRDEAVVRLRPGEPERDTARVPVPAPLPSERGGVYRIDHFWDVMPSGALLTGVNGDYRFELHGHGGVLRVERRDWQRVNVTDEERAAWYARYEWFEREPNRAPPPGEWVPDVMPSYGSLDAGADGRILVRRYVPSRQIEIAPSEPDAPPPVPFVQPHAYDVFEPDGTYLGRLEFPPGVEPRYFGDGVVWALRTGELGEQYVVRYTIVGTGMEEDVAPGVSPAGFWDVPRRGANLFNHVETRERLASAAELGLDFVRLAPDKWDGAGRDFLLGDADAYEGIPPADLAELRRTLDAAHAADIRVVLTMLSLPGARWRQNNDGEDDGRLWRDPAFREQAARFWGDLALELAGHPALVGYDLLNEPHPGAALADLDDPDAPAYAAWWKSAAGTPADLNAFFAEVTNAIRAADSVTPLVIEPAAYGAPDAFAYLEPVADSLVLYSFHFYEPWLYTTRRVNRGRYAYPDRMPVGWHEGVEAWPRDRIRDRLAVVDTWAERHDVPPSRILLGEFGVARLTAGAELWLADVIEAAEAHGWHWAFYSWREDGWSDMDYELGPDSLPPDVLASIRAGERSREAWRDNRLFRVIERRVGRAGEVNE